MSEKGVVSSLKNRERVSGSIFWRHSWHCSAYLSRELSFSKLNSPVRSWDNMARAKTNNNNKGGSWQRGQNSQRSSPSPSRLHHTQEAATPHTAPVSPLHDQRSNAYSGKDRRRIPGLSKAQRRIKASSTPALLDRDVESRQWSGDEEDEGTTGHVTTEHPLAEATIPLVSHSRLQEQPSNLSGNLVTASGTQNPPRSQSQQESVLLYFLEYSLAREILHADISHHLMQL